MTKKYFLYVTTAMMLLFTLIHTSNAQAIKQPKNIIIMIGDGMGRNHVKVGTMYQYGQDSSQKFQHFPVVLSMSTYSAKAGKTGEDGDLDWSHGYNTDDAWANFDWLKSKYTCSSASATALSCGLKTYNGGMGLDLDKQPLTNISQIAKSLGKSAGVATTVQLSHATPAGFVAHNVFRDNYSQIAREMLLGSKMDVIIGAGNPYFDHDGNKLASARTFKYVGDSLIWSGLLRGDTKFKLTDGSYQVQDIDGDGKPDPWKVIQTKEEFENAARGNVPKRLLGVAEAAETFEQRRGTTDDHTYFEGNNQGQEDPFVVPFNSNLPNLSTVSLASLNVLNKNKKGFFLMIEGGAIDWAAHGNMKGRVIEEFIDFAKAIDTVIAWVEKNSSWDETLLIVTADHETGYITGPDTEKKLPFANPIVSNGLPLTVWRLLFGGDLTTKLSTKN